MALVRGNVLDIRLKYIEIKADAEQRNKILDSLSPEFKAEIKKGIKAQEWYAFEYYIQFNRVIDRVLGKGDLQLIVDLGAFSAELALQGIYRFFYKLGSPEFLMKNTAYIWKNYFINGEITLESIEPYKARVVVENTEIPSHEHCLAIVGWIKRALEICGGKEVAFKNIVCRETDIHNNNICEFLFTWQD